jgi:hypothetical protein
MYDGGRPSAMTLHIQHDAKNYGVVRSRLVLSVKPNALSRDAQTYRGRVSRLGPIDRQYYAMQHEQKAADGA